MDQQIIAEQFISPEERTRLLHFCAKITGNPDVAEDMVQETLVEAWSHLQALRDSSRRAQWLTGVARNVCLRWQRSQQREKTHQLASLTDESPAELEDLLVDDFDIEVELERKELIDLLDRALALLPAETRSVLVKRYVEESPLQEVAAQLGMNVSAVAMRLQRGKLAMRRVLTTDLRQEIAPYATAATTEQWEETPLWCYRCGKHRLLGIRRPELGQLLLKCPGCTPDPNEVQSYNELPVLRGIKGYKPLFSRLINWCAHYYWTGLRDGTILCDQCKRPLPVRISRAADFPDWARSIDERVSWNNHPDDRFVAILCASCHASFKSVLECIILELPEGQQFLQAHPRIRTLPNQEVEAAGRPALVSRFESITDSATLTVVSDYETYRVLSIEGGKQ